jgi:hypothetical protein
MSEGNSTIYSGITDSKKILSNDTSGFISIRKIENSNAEYFIRVIMVLAEDSNEIGCIDLVDLSKNDESVVECEGIHKVYSNEELFNPETCKFDLMDVKESCVIIRIDDENGSHINYDWIVLPVVYKKEPTIQHIAEPASVLAPKPIETSIDGFELV